MVQGEARRDVTEGSPAAVVALGARGVMARHRSTSELPRAEVPAAQESARCAPQCIDANVPTR